jgi:hypothetical protein
MPALEPNGSDSSSCYIGKTEVHYCYYLFTFSIFSCRDRHKRYKRILVPCLVVQTRAVLAGLRCDAVVRRRVRPDDVVAIVLLVSTEKQQGRQKEKSHSYLSSG